MQYAPTKSGVIHQAYAVTKIVNVWFTKIVKVCYISKEGYLNPV